MASASSTIDDDRPSVRSEGELGSQNGKKASPLGPVAGTHRVERLLQHAGLLVIDLAGRAHAAPTVRQCGGHEPVTVAEDAGDGSGIEEGLAVRRITGAALSGAEPDEKVAAKALVGRHLGEEFERLAEPTERVGGSQVREGLLAGQLRVGECLRGVGGLGGGHEMSGQLGRPCLRSRAIELLEDLGDLAMRPCPTRRAQVLVEGVLSEGVGETEVLNGSLDLDEKPCPDAGVDDVEQCILVAVNHSSEDLDVEVAPDHRRLGEHPAHLLTEAVHPLSHHLADALGQALLVEVLAGDPTAGLVLVDEAGLAQVAEQFGGEEGISLGLLADRMTEVHTALVHLVPRKDLHHLDDLEVLESDEVDAHGARLAPQAGQGV